MKLVILAGGLGTRLSEETSLKPKPMVQIGTMPIIWHIMKFYSCFNINDFILCTGYKGSVFKDFFTNYHSYQSDICINTKDNSITYFNKDVEDWKIHIIDTGEMTNTGGRLLRIKENVDDTFLMTYGDGLSNVNISNLIEYHNARTNLVTLTAVQPPGRYGVLNFNESKQVTDFFEKPRGDKSWINGGFFVVNKKVFNYIKDDSTIWEHEPLKSLASKNLLGAFLHDGFWQSMDTLRDKNYLNDLWLKNKAPWKIW